ncbi:MAG: beta-L-arabinofuranosidase domain-containing protein [Lentisphaeria bacterium]
MSEMKDDLQVLTSGRVSLKGLLGKAIGLSIRNRLKKVDYRHLVSPFRERNETDGRWRCEFWGKIVRSAIRSWHVCPDAELLTLIKQTVEDICQTQTADGCISSYPAQLQTKDWDIWGRKYVMLGLARYYRMIEPSEKVREVLMACLDHLMGQVGPSHKNIVDCGHHGGMAASSILGAVIQVYRITGEKRFLEYAQWIAGQGGSRTESIFQKALDGYPPAGLGNGKAYEMMSCFEGLLELYRETGNPEYLETVKRFYQNVREQEIFVTGVGGLKDRCGEFWDLGRLKQTHCDAGILGETCVTVTFIRLSLQMLRLTGDLYAAEELERSLYNGILGAMLPDASWWMHRNPTPLIGPAGKVRAGDQLPGFGEDCCLAQGPEGLATAALFAVMKDDFGPVINLYEDCQAQVQVTNQNQVQILIQGGYPVHSSVRLQIQLAAATQFRLSLRIPFWSRKTRVLVAGEEYTAVPGTYLRIERMWKPGTEIELEFDLSLRVLHAPDGSGYVALRRGPLVLAQDSRLGDVGRPLPCNLQGLLLEPEPPQAEIPTIFRLPDDSLMCDYASAGNHFCPDNTFCVWMKTTDP